MPPKMPSKKETQLRGKKAKAAATTQKQEAPQTTQPEQTLKVLADVHHPPSSPGEVGPIPAVSPQHEEEEDSMDGEFNLILYILFQRPAVIMKKR